MNDTTPNNVTDYLTRLEKELDDVTPEVREDIVAGIREELVGLDPKGASARIADLGDPAFIAAEARAATPEQAVGEAATPAAPGRASSIAAVVILIAGSIVVPFVGALVGLAWISASRAWTRKEKLSAWLIPIVVAILVVVLSLILVSVNATGSHVALLVAYLVFPIEGIVFAVRGAHRQWFPAA